jgi:hypothetical protein
MKAAVTALFLFLSVVVWAQSAPTAQSSDIARDSISGPGFTLALPPQVEMDIRPTSDLAFGLNLTEVTHGREWDRLPPRYIGLTTRWTTDAGSLNDLVQSMTADLQSLVPAELVGGDGSIRLDSTFPAKLGDLPARRLIIEFKNRQKKPSLRQVVVAYRARPDASAVVYLVTLTTTRADFQQDVNLFAKLLSGFKLTPIQ